MPIPTPNLVRTIEATDAQLNFAVSQIECDSGPYPNYCGDARLAMRIAEREGIVSSIEGQFRGAELRYMSNDMDIECSSTAGGSTFIEAAMRCWVRHKYGEAFYVPAKLANL